MQLFLDIDGVLLNFERAFVGWLNSAYGMELPEDYETSRWDFGDILTGEQLHERWLGFLQSRYAAEMPPLLEPDRFNDLTGNHAVHLITNFPAAYMDKRKENLASLRLSYRTLHHGGLHALNGPVESSKAELVSGLRLPGEDALFVDDHPDNCLDVLHNCRGVEVWLMSRRFNRDFTHPRVKRAKDWETLMERLENAAPTRSS